MFAKTQLAIVGALSCCTMFCVGFASWQISYPTEPKTVSSTIVTDEVINSANFVRLDTNKANNGIETFKYNANGFVDDSGNKINEGSIIAHYVIDVENFRILLGDGSYSSLQVEIALKFASEVTNNIFTDYNSEKLVGSTISAEHLSEISSINDPKTHKNQIVASKLFENILTNESNVEFSVEFKFNLTDPDFKTYIYDVFNSGEKLTLIATAMGK